MKLIDRVVARLVPASKAVAGLCPGRIETKCVGAALYSRQYDNCSHTWTSWHLVSSTGCA